LQHLVKSAINLLPGAFLVTALGILAAPDANAQNASTSLTFEVASVKVAPVGPNGVRGGCHGIDSVYGPGQETEAPPLGRCVITDARLSHLIGIAYGVGMVDLKTGPDWIQRGDLRFNVEAKAEEPSKTTERQLLTMLQNMLVDRFQLKFHRETSQEAGFALVVAKNGPKLQVSRRDETRLSFTGPDGKAVLKPFPGQPISITARKVSISTLPGLLRALNGLGPVVDRTGLAGEYDFTLSWDEQNGPDLSTALREQLGLRMEAEKVPVSIFVVDSAQKPTAN
jgi:uncharacterized protein (TIGR03435 family)